LEVFTTAKFQNLPAAAIDETAPVPQLPSLAQGMTAIVETDRKIGRRDRISA